MPVLFDVSNGARDPNELIGVALLNWKHHLVKTGCSSLQRSGAAGL